MHGHMLTSTSSGNGVDRGIIALMARAYANSVDSVCDMFWSSGRRDETEPVSSDMSKKKELDRS
jgi:hypothetical protein